MSMSTELATAVLNDSSLHPSHLPAHAHLQTTVRFIEGENGCSMLEVETGDRSGLLLSLSQALFKQRVQIVASQVKTVNSRVFDRFTIVELDGTPITPARRLEIQVAVLTAIDPILEQQFSRTPSTPPAS